MSTDIITKVALLDLNRQYQPFENEIEDAFQSILKSKQFIMGPHVEALENNMKQYCGVNSAVAVSSGTDALILALMALGIGPGDEVITTPFSFFATAGSIARVGARPVFCDICPNTYNIDSSKIVEKITPYTKAIMPVHLFGQMADMDAILKIADQHQLYVIEDAAQAIGASYQSQDGKVYKAGSMGDLGCFSFFPSKNLGALGDAGLVTINGDDSLLQKVRCLRMHGETKRYHHQFVGGNFRMDSIQAAFINIKLKYLDKMHQKRQENANFYNDQLASYVIVPNIHPSCQSIYNQYTLATDKRDELKKALDQACIGNAIYYPVPLHLQDCFDYLENLPGTCPIAEAAAEKVLSIPIAECSAEELHYVADIIKDFFKTLD